jgi:hypothetical protein
MSETEQLLLPIEIRPQETVSWFSIIQTEKRRRFGGTKIATELAVDPKTKLAVTTEIEVSKINELTDKNLRYALRLQSAARQTGHMVTVDAIEDGLDSRFIKAEYSGVSRNGTDTFMRDIQDFAPQPQVPGLTAVLVKNESGPSTRYWVQQAEAISEPS